MDVFVRRINLLFYFSLQFNGAGYLQILYRGGKLYFRQFFISHEIAWLRLVVHADRVGHFFYQVSDEEVRLDDAGELRFIYISFPAYFEFRVARGILIENYAILVQSVFPFAVYLDLEILLFGFYRINHQILMLGNQQYATVSIQVVYTVFINYTAVRDVIVLGG